MTLLTLSFVNCAEAANATLFTSLRRALCFGLQIVNNPCKLAAPWDFRDLATTCDKPPSAAVRRRRPLRRLLAGPCRLRRLAADADPGLSVYRRGRAGLHNRSTASGSECENPHSSSPSPPVRRRPGPRVIDRMSLLLYSDPLKNGVGASAPAPNPSIEVTITAINSGAVHVTQKIGSIGIRRRHAS